LFLQGLNHTGIIAVRSKGLLIAVELANPQQVLTLVEKCIDKGLFTDWFLFAQNCLRIAPPLTITKNEIAESCRIITSSLSDMGL